MILRDPDPADKAAPATSRSGAASEADLTEPAAAAYPADAEDERQRQRDRAERLLEVLTLERIEENLYRATNEVRGRFRLFGGQVLAQALRAASHTVTGTHVHSLHG